LSVAKYDAQITHRNFQVFRVLGSTLRMKAQAGSSSRGWKDFICREEKKRKKLHGGVQGDPETSGPMGQVGNWVFIALVLYCPRAEMSLRRKQTFPREEKCLLGQFSLFGISCSLSFSYK
jgi:hypothetical protein